MIAVEVLSMRGLFVFLLVASFGAAAQTPATDNPVSAAVHAPVAATSAPADPAAATRQITVPAGTQVLLNLKSPDHY